MIRQLIQRFVFAAIAIGLAGLGPANAAFAQGGSGNTLSITVEADFINPNLVNVKPNTTVTWQNLTARNYTIVVTGGKPWKRSCSDPDSTMKRGPSLDLDPAGEVSLCFVSPGTYSFSLAPVGKMTLSASPQSGTINVVGK
jgi:plastocyanin